MRDWRQRLTQMLCTGLLLCSPLGKASVSIPGYELIYDAPSETTLNAGDLRNSAEVWREMIDGAQQHIDIAQFYVANEAGSRLTSVIESLRRAGERGVKIRFLLEEKGVKISTPATLEQLKSVPNLSLRIIPFGKLAGGIVHAKYWVVDGKRGFLGSQNFDWRALEHIHETGLLIDNATVVAQMAAVFQQDWDAQALLAAGKPVPEPGGGALPSNLLNGNYLVASPRRWDPRDVPDSQAVLPLLLASAKTRIRVQVMDYAPLSFGENRSRPFYGVIDNALRAAAARGVQVELMVADWNTKQPEISWLKSLALVPNVQIKVVTIPQTSRGFIPFARVVHSKIMTIDHRLAWVGTSNWSGGYLDNSRNLEMVMNSGEMAERLDGLYQQLWQSRYAKMLHIQAEYLRPDPGGVRRSQRRMTE